MAVMMCCSFSDWLILVPVLAIAIRSPTSQSTACSSSMVVDPLVAVLASLVQVIPFGFPLDYILTSYN